MKILLITPEYPPHTIGGGGNVYPNLVRNYTKLGHKVVIIYGHYPTESATRNISSYKKGGIFFHQLPEFPTPASFPYLKIRMPLNFNSLTSISRIIKQEKPDAAHLHGYGFASIDTFAWFLKKANIPYILTIHGWPVAQANKNPLVKFLVDQYLLHISNRTLKHASIITTVSNALKSLVPKQFSSKTSVIYNPFESGSIAKETVKQAKSGVSVLSLGRISKDKGFQEIVRLIPGLLKAGIKAHYYIAGRDEGYLKTLKSQIADLKLEKNITFLGQVNKETKWKLINKADFIAIPSFIEGFGLVVLEAISRNKMILYGRSEAVKEVLGNYPNKISVYDENFTKLIQTKKILSKKFNFAPFEENRIAKQYLKLLNQITNKSL